MDRDSEQAPPPEINDRQLPDPSDEVYLAKIPQQASTAPGDGTHMYEEPNATEIPGSHNKVPFKEQVLGYAKKTRGTILGKPDLKLQGEKLLQGEGTIKNPPAV